MLSILLNNNPYSTCFSHKFRNWLFITLFLFCQLAGISGDAQQIQINSYRNYDTRNGLVSLNVRKIIQDKYGFLWCATQDGLSRFDGRQFVNFSANTADSRFLLKGSDVFDLLPDENGEDIWALTAYGGLNKISTTKCRIVERFNLMFGANSAGDYWYKCMKFQNGFAYIGTDEGVLLKFCLRQNKVIASYSLPDQAKIRGAIDEVMISKSNIWLFSSGKGITVIDTAFKNNVAFIDSVQLGQNSTRSFFFYDYAQIDNQVWVATDIGLKIISTESFKLLGKGETALIPEPLRNEVIRCITRSQKDIYISGNAGLIQLNISTNSAKQILFSKNNENKPWFNLANALMVSGNNLWLATQYGILNTGIMPSAFTSYTSSVDNRDVRIQHCMTLLPIDDSMIYTCADDGLYLTNQKSGVIRKVLSDDIVYSIFRKDSDSYIASGGKALYLLGRNGEKRNIEFSFPELKPIIKTAFIVTATYKDSLHFLAGLFGNGIYVWDAKHNLIKQLNTNTVPGLKSNNINRLFFDNHEKLWVVCDNCFSVYDIAGNSIQHFTISIPGTNKPIGINMDICETNNRFWIASYGTGILELDKGYNIKKVWGAESGINNLGLYKIASINNESIAASSNNGLAIINTQNGRCRNYFETDGLNTNNFEETSGDLYKNNLFFGGLNGFTKIELSKLTKNSYPPTVFFTKISFDLPHNNNRDTSDLSITKITVPENTLQTTVNFTGINPLNPGLITYAYRIAELHEDWINLSDQNFVTAIGLSPGTYHLQVQAFNEDGVPSEIKTLTLIFLPKWYQTLFFKIMVALAIIAIAYALYRIRINQLKKEQQIRTKLASDLHDDLGSTMNSVKLFTNLAIMEQKPDKYLPLIKDGTQEAINSIRDIIWVLDDKKDGIDDLLSRIRHFALPLCEANQTRYRQEVADNTRDLTLGQEEKRNLYMMMKEAINNAIKYAGCKNITITISAVRSRLSIGIEDDGKGFDTAKASDGNGLKNMKRRAEEINYTVSINSSPGNGTSILFTKT